MKKNANYTYPAVKKSLEAAQSLTDVCMVIRDYIIHKGNESAGNLILFIMMAAKETDNPYVKQFAEHKATLEITIETTIESMEMWGWLYKE